MSVTTASVIVNVLPHITSAAQGYHRVSQGAWPGLCSRRPDPSCLVAAAIYTPAFACLAMLQTLVLPMCSLHQHHISGLAFQCVLHAMPSLRPHLESVLPRCKGKLVCVCAFHGLAVALHPCRPGLTLSSSRLPAPASQCSTHYLLCISCKAGH